MPTHKAQLRDRHKSHSLRFWQANPQSFRRVVLDWRFLTALVLLILFTNWLGERWIFQSGSLQGMDTLLRTPKPVPATHCSLITISEEEFTKYLGESLDPKKLSSVLQAILQYGPKVLVIDIDTSASRFQDVDIKPGGSKIVWARVSRQTLTVVPGQRQRAYQWQVGSVLGNRNPQPDYIGTPIFPQDPDSTVRNFQRTVQMDSKSPALYWETLRAYCASRANDNSGAATACGVIKNSADTDFEERPFRKDWEFRSFALSDVMAPSGNLRPQPGELGDVVLLGGNFNDIHPTAFGPKLGIELTGSAIESELDPSQPRLPSAWLHWILKIALAMVIAWLNSRLLPLWATLGTLLLLTLVFMASFVGVYYRVFQLDFLPFMIGIWIEQLVETAERSHHHMASYADLK